MRDPGSTFVCVCVCVCVCVLLERNQERHLMSASDLHKHTSTHVHTTARVCTHTHANSHANLQLYNTHRHTHTHRKGLPTPEINSEKGSTRILRPTSAHFLLGSPGNSGTPASEPLSHHHIGDEAFENLSTCLLPGGGMHPKLQRAGSSMGG